MTLSFDSLVIPQKKRINVIKRQPRRFIPMGRKSIQKMLAYPHKHSLRQRLLECQRRLRQREMAVTTTKHVSPRSKRRHRRRSRRRPRRRSSRRSSRRSARRSPRRRRSRRRSRRPL